MFSSNSTTRGSISFWQFLKKIPLYGCGGQSSEGPYIDHVDGLCHTSIKQLYPVSLISMNTLKIVIFLNSTIV